MAQKRVIITGGSDGLGLELSKLFLDNGFDVVCISRTKPELKLTHIPTDLTNPDDVEKAISTIKAKFPEFNFLINCAGIISIKPANEIGIKEVGDIFMVNVISHMRLVSDCLT